METLKQFKGELVVVKYGGSFMDNPDVDAKKCAAASIAHDIATLRSAEILVVIVHGGGKAITRELGKLGIPSEFVGGLRVTTDAAAEVIEKVLSEEINSEIVESINDSLSSGCAIGVRGRDVLICKRVLAKDDTGRECDIGFVGEVTEVKTTRIQNLLCDGNVPVISPTAVDVEGRLYNCNADEAAAKVAGALKANRLFFMSDIPGVLLNRDDPSSMIKVLSASDVPRLKEQRIIESGMIPKLDSSLRALRAGVQEVRLIDGRKAGVLTSAFIGTEGTLVRA